MTRSPLLAAGRLRWRSRCSRKRRKKLAGRGDSLVQPDYRRPRFETLEDRRLLAFDVSFLAAGLFDIDGIANFTGGAADFGSSFDGVDGFSSLLVTDAFALDASPTTGNGLPDDGFFPANAFHPDVQLDYRNADNGDNIRQLGTAESFTVSQVAGFSFSQLHLFSMTGGGAMPFFVELEYQDGGITILQSISPDWFDTVTDGSQQGDAIQYALIDGMDREEFGYDDANAAAIFGHSFPVDPARPLASVTVRAGVSVPPTGLMNVLGMTLEPSLDFGDIASGGHPTALIDDGARHVATGPRLGDTVTTEVDAKAIAVCCPLLDAIGDEDDGVEFSAGGVLSAGTTAEVRVSLVNADGASNRLDAWIDWNANGVFENNEKIFDNFDLGVSNGDQVLPVSVPATVVSGFSFARFRLSTAGGLGPSGLAADGEVEDLQVEVRRDGVHFAGALVGVDFDASGGAIPANWNAVNAFDVTGQSFTNLIAESGFISPYTLTLSSTLSSTQGYDVAIANALPVHSNPLDGLDGIISSGGDSQSGDIFAVWSGLRPGATYEVYVFGLDETDFDDDLTITVNGFPPISFQQTPTNHQLWVNAAQSDGSALVDHAIITKAGANGEIQINIQQNADSEAIAIAGLAIEQLPYPGPRVLTTTVNNGATVQYQGQFAYTVEIDSGLMGSIDVDAIELVGDASGPQPAALVSASSTGASTLYTFQFDGIPDDDYTLRLLSGDGLFEDNLGADLDGNEDGVPGGDFMLNFSTVRTGFSWHNKIFSEDVNGDGGLTVTDLRQIFTFFDGNSGPLDPAGPAFDDLYMDVNDDGSLTITDVRLVFVGVGAGLQGPGEGEGLGEGEGVASPVDFQADAEEEEEERWLAAWLALVEEGF